MLKVGEKSGQESFEAGLGQSDLVPDFVAKDRPRGGAAVPGGELAY